MNANEFGCPSRRVADSAFEQLVCGLDEHSGHRLRIRSVIGDGGEVETVDDGDERVDHLGGGEFEEFELKALHSVVDDASEQPAPPVEDRVDGGRRLFRGIRSEEHTSELQSRFDLVCRLLLEKKRITQGMN